MAAKTSKKETSAETVDSTNPSNLQSPDTDSLQALLVATWNRVYKKALELVKSASIFSHIEIALPIFYGPNLTDETSVESVFSSPYNFTADLDKPVDDTEVAVLPEERELDWYHQFRELGKFIHLVIKWNPDLEAQEVYLEVKIPDYELVEGFELDPTDSFQAKAYKEKLTDSLNEDGVVFTELINLWDPADIYDRCTAYIAKVKEFKTLNCVEFSDRVYKKEVSEDDED